MFKVTSTHILNARKSLELYNQAQALIGMKDYKGALEMAEKIKELGFVNHCSSIWIDVAKENNQPELMEKARELIVPVAKELCERGFHLSEANHYRKIGMEDEYRAAWAEYLEALNSRNINKHGYALADRMVWGEDGNLLS